MQNMDQPVLMWVPRIESRKERMMVVMIGYLKVLVNMIWTV